MDKAIDPITTKPPTEIPLPNAPLVRVLAQVRFPLIVSIDKAGFIAPFQEALRPNFPKLRPEHTQKINLGPQGPSAERQVIWRFSDIEDHWRVSLAPDFLALETTRYTSRADFIGRFASVVAALDEHVDPKVVDRLGIRYIDRILGKDVSNLGKLVRPEILGLLATPARQHSNQSVTESVFSVPDSKSKLLVRTGHLPPSGTIDPNVLEPANAESWILDIDMFSAESRSFDKDEIEKQARSFSERIYTFFRWAVTEDFLKAFGGNL